jgi:hypothetical protein
MRCYRPSPDLRGMSGNVYSGHETRSLTLLDHDVSTGNGVHPQSAARQQRHADQRITPDGERGDREAARPCHSTVARWTDAISLLPSASIISSVPSSGSAREPTTSAGSVRYPVKPVSTTASMLAACHLDRGRRRVSRARPRCHRRLRGHASPSLSQRCLTTVRRGGGRRGDPRVTGKMDRRGSSSRPGRKRSTRRRLSHSGRW